MLTRRKRALCSRDLEQEHTNCKKVQIDEKVDLFTNIPVEIMLVIASYLDTKSLGRLGITCRKAQNIVSETLLARYCEDTDCTLLIEPKFGDLEMVIGMLSSQFSRIIIKVYHGDYPKKLKIDRVVISENVSLSNYDNNGAFETVIRLISAVCFYAKRFKLEDEYQVNQTTANKYCAICVLTTNQVINTYQRNNLFCAFSQSKPQKRFLNHFNDSNAEFHYDFAQVCRCTFNSCWPSFQTDSLNVIDDWNAWKYAFIYHQESAHLSPFITEEILFSCAFASVSFASITPESAAEFIHIVTQCLNAYQDLKMPAISKVWSNCKRNLIFLLFWCNQTQLQNIKAHYRLAFHSDDQHECQFTQLHLECKCAWGKMMAWLPTVRTGKK